jgi:hypothetical protein
MARRSPPRKVTYFEPVPPRLARNTIIESTFEVGRHFRCTMRVNCGELDPAALIRPVPEEWHPRMPERLDRRLHSGAAAAQVRFIVWCRECRYQAEPATASLGAAEGGTSADPAEMAERDGPETPVADWHKRLVCSRCGSHDTDMVVTGERR